MGSQQVPWITMSRGDHNETTVGPRDNSGSQGQQWVPGTTVGPRDHSGHQGMRLERNGFGTKMCPWVSVTPKWVRNCSWGPQIASQEPLWVLGP